MAAQAKKVHVVDLQQPRIGRPMRRVARQASFVGLHRRMLEDERSHGVGVALGADRKLSGGRPHLVPGLRSVRIVAVTALDQSNIDPMAIGPREFGLLLRVAAIAQLGLRLHQQEINVGGFVRTMTTGAANAIGQVFGLGEVLGLQAGLVALGADGRGLRRA